MGEAKDENLEAAFEDLEQKVNQIKQNLEMHEQSPSPDKGSLSVGELEQNPAELQPRFE